MAKLAVFFFAALAFQAAFATFPEFHHEGKLVNYLDEIHTEVKDLTLFLEKEFPNNEYAIKTVTWQCRKFVEVVEAILSKLREETFTTREGGLQVFKQVIYILEEVRDNLREVTIYHDITKVHELKLNFIRCVKVVYENVEKLVNLTYTVYPEFRYTLKYVLVDFINVLHGIRSHFLHINQGFEVVETPRVLIKEIHEYTREFTETLKEFIHPTQVKVALREYLMYVNEIVHKLQEENFLGHKELDVVLHHLTNKLREIVFPVMQIMSENTVDMKAFRTKIITDLYEVVSIFEQLVQLCEDKVLPLEIRTFLIRVIYHYCYAIKHVIHETRFGHKIGFYTPKYYNTEYYGKHGYGLYELDFHHRLHTPYTYETLFQTHKYEVEPIYGKTLEWNKYFSGLKYESPKDLVLTIQILVKRIFERFEHNTWEVTDVKTVLFHHIREYITILDYILEKFETKITFERTLYTEKYVEEFIYKCKEIRRELREIINTEVLTNLPELKVRFLHYIEVLATEWCKLIEKCEVHDFEHFWAKEICMKFITFLNKISFEYKNVESNYYTPNKYETLFPTHKYEVEPIYGKTLEWNKYFSGLKYESPKDLVLTIQMLVKSIFERFEHNTWEVTDVKTVLIHHIREYITILDYILEKFETKITLERTLYTEKYVKEFIYKCKEIRRELGEIINTEVLTNLPELKVRFLHYIEVLATEWCKLIEKCEVHDFEHFWVKEICMKLITFLNKISFEYKNVESSYYTPNKYETLFPTHKYEVEPIYGKTLEWNKYFSGLKYESPKDLVLTIQMLVKRIFERFEHNTWEVTDVKTVLIHHIREYITILDYILEKFETKITLERTLYTEKFVEEFIYKCKEIRRELREIINTEVLTNLPELKVRFLHYIEVLATEWCKLIEKCEVHDFQHFWAKEICMKFITFLNKISDERTYTPVHYPLKEVTGYFPKYYKDNTFVPYVFTHHWRY